MEKRRLLVVGSGMASLRLLEELTVLARDVFDITVVGEESEPAYNRVLLSPLLAGEIAIDDVRTKSRNWYADQGVHLVTGASVVRIDAKAKRADLSTGDALSFDVCVLATGSAPIRLAVPGADLAGVEVFRSLADIPRMLAAAQTGGRAVVIGGGLLGIEAAYGLKRGGADVTLLHVMDRLMERQLDAEAAALLKSAIERKGVHVALNADTSRIEGATAVEYLTLRDGRQFPASLIVMAVGVRPRIELAKSAGLACGRGVVVNDRMETSAPGIYAIGECAEHRGCVYGLVEPAYEHARVAACVLAGKATAYGGTVLATNLKVSGVPVFSAGDFDGAGAEPIVWRDSAASAYRKFIVRDGKLAGVVLLGDTTDALWYRDLIRSGEKIARFRSSLPFGRAFAEAA
ncbi:MAG: NAD(P)/FAD-dependent oxidoreductase [Hyphomicrobium sp.]